MFLGTLHSVKNSFLMSGSLHLVSHELEKRRSNMTPMTPMTSHVSNAKRERLKPNMMYRIKGFV